MDTSNITIKSVDLIIKGISLEYKEDIFREFTSEITTYMSPKPPDSIKDTIDFIKNSMLKNKNGSDFVVVITKKETGEFIGCGGAHNINTKTPELGIWIKKSAHGFGYGMQAVIAIKNWIINNLAFEHIVYNAAENNLPTRKIAEQIGGKKFREYDEVTQNNKNLHFIEYRIFK